MLNMFCSQYTDLLQHLFVSMYAFLSTAKTRVWLLWQWKSKVRNLLVHHKFSNRLMKITGTDLYSKETSPIHLCLLFLEKMTWTQASQPYKINELKKLKTILMIWGRLWFTKQPWLKAGVSTGWVSNSNFLNCNHFQPDYHQIMSYVCYLTFTNILKINAKNHLTWSYRLNCR